MLNLQRLLPEEIKNGRRRNVTGEWSERRRGNISATSTNGMKAGDMSRYFNARVGFMAS